MRSNTKPLGHAVLGVFRRPRMRQHGRSACPVAQSLIATARPGNASPRSVQLVKLGHQSSGRGMQACRFVMKASEHQMARRRTRCLHGARLDDNDAALRGSPRGRSWSLGLIQIHGGRTTGRENVIRNRGWPRSPKHWPILQVEHHELQATSERLGPNQACLNRGSPANVTHAAFFSSPRTSTLSVQCVRRCGLPQLRLTFPLVSRCPQIIGQDASDPPADGVQGVSCKTKGWSR